MGKKTKNAFEEAQDEKAEAWFAQHDDELPAEVFTDDAARKRIGEEIYRRVYLEIRPLRTIRLRILQAAAAVLILFSAGLIFSEYHTADKAAANVLSWKIYRSREGQTRVLRLADSSMVTLHPGAVLMVPSNFGSTKRTVKLAAGEAYFKIKRDTAHPFSVASGKLAVKVLGTAFNVRNNVKAGQTEVSVSEGKVEVAGSDRVLGLLTRGKRLTYDIATGNAVLDQVHLSAVAAWRRTSIDLEDVSFSELSEVFSSFYGSTLEAGNPKILQFRYTLTIDKEKDALSTSKLIAKIHGLKFRESNGKITLQ